MWTLVFFDLPGTTKEERRAYERFRADLRRLGFEMLQESVYARWEDSGEAAAGLRRRVFARAPAKGQVAVLPLSWRTWKEMRVRGNGGAVARWEKPSGVLVLADEKE